MAAPYLQELEALLANTAATIGSETNIDARHFFSGAAAHAEGRMFISLTPAGLALKLSEADRDILYGMGGRPLKYFPKAPVKKDYLVLPDAIAADDAALAGWIEKSVAHVLTLPQPRPKSGGRK
jgi:TfoX/Sxy family transcriptional regulator of competence genes